MLAAPRNIRFYEGDDVVTLSSTRGRLCIIRLNRVPVSSSLLVYQELQRVKLPQFGQPNLISVVWSMGIKSSIFIQFSVIIENGCWRDRRMFRGYIRGTLEGRSLWVWVLSLHEDTMESTCCHLIMPFRLPASTNVPQNKLCCADQGQAFHNLSWNPFLAYSADPLSLDFGGLTRGKGPACDWSLSCTCACLIGAFEKKKLMRCRLLVYLSSGFYLWSPAPVCRGAWRPFCKHNPNLHPRKTFWPRSLRQTESGASTAVNVDSLMSTCITSAEVIYSSVQKHNLIGL